MRHVGAVAVLEVRGSLTARDDEIGLRKAIRLAVDEEARVVVLNLRDVQDIDSSGVSELASGHITVTNRGGHLKLSNLSRKLKHVFAITRLKDVFEIYETEAEAIASAEIP